MIKTSKSSVAGIQIGGVEFWLGILVAPLFLAVVWFPPVGLDDFFSQTYLLVLALNLLTAYPDFLFHFLVSHLLVRKFKLAALPGYLIIVALLSSASAVFIHVLHFRGINGLGYQDVVVLRDGAITPAGVLFVIKAVAINVFGHCGAMLILLYLVLRRRARIYR